MIFNKVKYLKNNNFKICIKLVKWTINNKERKRKSLIKNRNKKSFLGLYGKNSCNLQ